MKLFFNMYFYYLLKEPIGGKYSSIILAHANSAIPN
jgi:hypothetical protein